jgi:hypothetical protein
VLSHADDSSLLLSMAMSFEHFSFSVRVDGAELDELPPWPLLEPLAPGPRAVTAAELLTELGRWQLSDEIEASTLVKFKKMDSFNSSLKAAHDKLLDYLLERSGAKVQMEDVEGGGSKQVIKVREEDFAECPGGHRRPRSKVFGERLDALVRDVETCRFAYLAPGLGIPYVVEEVSKE